jgi:hypothetical protein
MISVTALFGAGKVHEKALVIAPKIPFTTAPFCSLQPPLRAAIWRKYQLTLGAVALYAQQICLAAILAGPEYSSSLQDPRRQTREWTDHTCGRGHHR